MIDFESQKQILKEAIDQSKNPIELIEKYSSKLCTAGYEQGAKDMYRKIKGHDEKQKRGYNDRMYMLNFIMTWTYTYICIILTIIGPKIGIEDYSFVTLVCPLIWADFGLHTGFIVHKARVENLSKHSGKEVIKNANMNINMDI